MFIDFEKAFNILNWEKRMIIREKNWKFVEGKENY